MRLLILIFFALSVPVANAITLETICNNKDCFTSGWVTTEPGTDYLLTCQCKSGDCVNQGWESQDNRNSTFDVTCKPGGCFTEGWTSVQNDKGLVLIDVVLCKEGSCLTHGWDIITTYDGDGEVTCKGNDCSSFGGLSYWRGQLSETTCYNSDCYRYGWHSNIR
ncbi:MAG: hypothetical protein KDD43_10815 [Bdellovibrionales bacterium]|nr:hypothetical protein [Bdellovibrionales bacterium]